MVFCRNRSKELYSSKWLSIVLEIASRIAGMWASHAVGGGGQTLDVALNC